MTDALEDFTRGSFSYRGVAHDVYRKGEGPAVLVFAEMPGITPKVARLRRPRRGARLHRGCCRTSSASRARRRSGAAMRRRSGRRACRRSSRRGPPARPPGVEWCRRSPATSTSGSAAPASASSACASPATSRSAMLPTSRCWRRCCRQPSLPLGFDQEGAARRSQRRRPREGEGPLAAEDLCVLGLRFTGDRARARRALRDLREALGDAFVGVEIDSSKGNPRATRQPPTRCSPSTSSTSPASPTRDALEQVLDLFRTRLLAPVS